ncbi:MAG: flagellin [Hyphomonadaceae bacterium]
MVDRIVNTSGALDVLRQLQSSSSQLEESQTRVSTGQKIRTASDNAPLYLAAASMRGQVSSLQAVTLSLGRAESVSDMAISAGETVSNLLIELKNVAVQAQSEDLSSQQRDAYNQQYHDYLSRIETFVRSASFDGANLLDGTKPQGAPFIADADGGQTLTLSGRNILPGAGILTIDGQVDLSSASTAATVADRIDESIANLSRELGTMSGENQRLKTQMTFISRLADVLGEGVSNLVDADMGLESARVKALQVKQSLSSETLSIANQAPQALLSLLRGS